MGADCSASSNTASEVTRKYVLGHKREDMVEPYDQHDMPKKRREALQSRADELQPILGIEVVENVIPLRRGNFRTSSRTGFNR